MIKNEVNYEEQIAAAEAKVAELKKAQAEQIEAEKKAASLARKEEAVVVNTAIDAYEEAKKVCNTKIKEAYDEYRAKVNAAEKELSVLEADADAKLNAFLDAHPEGFHYTYKSADGSVVRDYAYRKNQYNVFDNFNVFQDMVKNLWKF